MFKIGCDIVHIPRIKRLTSSPTTCAGLLRRIFQEKEIELMKTRFPNPSPEYIAGRFALKEAIFKSCSPFKRVLWKDISILPTSPINPIPVVEWRDGSSSIKVEISLSHDGEYAIANAISYKVY